MKSARNWIIGSGVAAFLAFTTRGIITGEDIPSGIQNVLMVVIGAGLGAEPLAGLAGKVLGKKKEGGEE